MINSSRFLFFFIVNISVLCFTSIQKLNSQSIVRQVISFSGQLLSTTNYNVSSTSGEVVTFQSEKGTLILTNGFQQPQENEIVGTISLENKDIDISVYPNPTLSIVHLSLELADNIELYIGVMDVNGREVVLFKKYYFSDAKTLSINMSKLSSGIYFLIIKDNKGNIKKNYKIQKVN